MTIFSRKLTTTDKDTKFTGVHLPLELNEYLVMYAMANGIPKSGLVVNQMINWKEEMEQEISINDLVDGLVEKALANLTSKKSLPAYLATLHEELDKKGVSKDIIIKIKKRVRNEA